MFHPNKNGDEYKEWLIRRISGYGMEINEAQLIIILRLNIAYNVVTITFRYFNISSVLKAVAQGFAIYPCLQ